MSNRKLKMSPDRIVTHQDTDKKPDGGHVNQNWDRSQQGNRNGNPGDNDAVNEGSRGRNQGDGGRAPEGRPFKDHDRKDRKSRD